MKLLIILALTVLAPLVGLGLARLTQGRSENKT